MEFSVEELAFAQKYPFSLAAKNVVKDSALSISRIPRDILQRAASLVARAFTGTDYKSDIKGYKEIMRTEILAFPVSKIIVSAIDRLELNRKYVSMLGKYFFENLSGENERTLVDIGLEMKVRFDLVQKGNCFAKVSIADYLRPEHDDAASKLVNQNVSGGNVMLTRDGFAKLLSDIAMQEIKDSLPLDISGADEGLILAAKDAEKEFFESLRKSFSKTDFGEVKPEAFPPCMSKIYSELIAGIKVNHMGRFAVAAFLNTAGMTSEQIIGMYRQTPNFDERITRYQVERIAGTKGSVKKGYSCPSCDKMRSYNLCVANCPVSHPVRFYEREITRDRKNNSHSS